VTKEEIVLLVTKELRVSRVFFFSGTNVDSCPLTNTSLLFFGHSLNSIPGTYLFCSFGNSATYHADNEYASLKDMQDAFQILLRVISMCDKQE
jgi:acetylornithine deacetylase/succinyl-diaminopimelate desuccinylase-like protein